MWDDASPTTMAYSWRFTTGAQVYQHKHAMVDEVTFFQIPSRRRNEDTCLDVSWDREYLVRLPEPLTREPFIYEVRVDNGDSIERFGWVSHDLDDRPRAYAVIPIQTTWMGAHPCLSVEVRDIAGRVVSSSSSCVPYGCLDEQWRVFEDPAKNHWNEVDRWEAEATACDGSYLAKPKQVETAGCTSTHGQPVSWFLFLFLLGALSQRRWLDA